MLTSIKSNVSARIAAGAVGVAMIVSLGLGSATPALAAGLTSTQVQSILSLLSSFGADQATINNVNAALNGQATTGTTGTTATASSYTFTKDLTVGSTGADVKALQQFLNAHGATVATSGAGSAGMETSTFGPATKAALVKFQSANGITPASGYFGPKTRAFIASMGGTTTTTTTTGGTTTTTTATGPGVTIAMATQPANSLAPVNASRVPFTTFTLTNNTSSSVTISSVTVQRAGLAQDAAFNGVVLVDQNGLQVGIAHTFNSNHQANIGDNFTLAAGQSMTYTVAGNMETSAGGYAGQIAQLQVVAVNTTVPVSGSLPIVGASQTINETLSLGSVSTSTSSYDPGTNQNKHIGDTAVRFSGIRFTAASAEDLKLNSIRWRQTGTASASDISNVVTLVNGTSYPTTVDSTGKYYTTVFPNGILISKGNSVDVYVQGDITGSGAATRTVQMNIDKVTDVYFVGQLYGFGIAPSGTLQPWYTGYTTTILGGSATTVQNNSAVAAANIPVNVNNTVLGGFTTSFLGEPVSVSKMVFTVSSTSPSNAAGHLTSVSIVDQNGSVVAGPVDEASDGTLTFTDTVTIPVGTQNYTLEGKVPSTAANGDTYYLSTTPSSQWTNITGQITGNTVSLSSLSNAIAMNTMTVKGAALTITASPNPVAQSIVAGNGVTLANVQLDASQSGEDVRLNNFIVSAAGTGTTNLGALNACQLYNGATALNSGSNVLQSVASGSNTITFDQALTVPKGTVMTLALKCNISTSISDQATLTFGVNSGYAYTATGVQSGNSIAFSASNVTTATSGTQTVSSKGTVTATAASSAVAQPSLAITAAGTTGVTVGYVKFHATNEAVNLTKVGLTLGYGTYGSKSTGAGNSSNNGVNDVAQAYIYNGSTLVGTASFTGTGATATSTLTSPVVLAKDADTVLTIKADLASVGVSAAGGIGDTLTIDPLNYEGSGANSGQTIKGGATQGVNGVQLFRTAPTVAFVSNSTNPNGTNVVLKKFTITAGAANPVGIYQMAFTIATSSASAYNFKLYGYTDSGYSQGISSQGSGTGQIGGATCATQTSCVNNPTAVFTVASSIPFQIPAGSTYYFALLGTVTPNATANNWTISPTLLGDAAISTIGGTPTYIATTTAAIAASGITASTGAGTLAGSDFIWSDNATTTAGQYDVDWTNGYQVAGLPSTGI